jgi:hypothetical protein
MQQPRPDLAEPEPEGNSNRRSDSWLRWTLYIALIVIAAASLGIVLGRPEPAASYETARVALERVGFRCTRLSSEILRGSPFSSGLICTKDSQQVSVHFVAANPNPAILERFRHRQIRRCSDRDLDDGAFSFGPDSSVWVSAVSRSSNRSELFGIPRADVDAVAAALRIPLAIC